jgi:hypothetical protein
MCIIAYSAQGPQISCAESGVGRTLSEYPQIHGAGNGDRKPGRGHCPARNQTCQAEGFGDCRQASTPKYRRR